MKRLARIDSRTIKTALLAGSLLALATPGGCVSYTNVPTPMSAPAFKNPNHFQAIKVARRALEEVVRRYPAADEHGQYCVNMPQGTSLESARQILGDLPAGAVLPHEGMDPSIPTYHIGRIWIRASDAKVDVIYPSRGFDGSTHMGNVTVWLNGGMQRWRVSRVQHWAPGTIAVPELYEPLPEAVLKGEAVPEGGDASHEDEGVEASAASMPEPTEHAEPAPESASEPVAEPGEEPASGVLYREVPVDD